MANDKSAGLVKSPFTINKSADGATFLTADLVTSTDKKTILTYKVPLGVAIEITPANYFFFVLKDTAAVTISAGLSFLDKRNANGTESREIWSGSNAIFGDLGDEFKRPRIKVPVVINASQQLIASVKNLGSTLDFDFSDVQVECMQYYEEI